MKILVFSDSHQQNNFMRDVIKMHKKAGNVDCIFHLGDGVCDLEGLSPDVPVCFVDGNYEEYITSYLSRKNLRCEAVIDFLGFRFFLTHGHRYGVKKDFDSALIAARKRGADVLVFGHTHEQFYQYIPSDEFNEKPIYIFNPGSISRPRDNKFSYGIIEIQNNSILFTHATI